MNYQRLVIMAFVAFVVASYCFGYTPPLVGVVFFLASLLAYYYYAKDKKAAINSSWRVPENKLHLLALCCGWPGALMAQEKLRHKTKKSGFRVVFWCTVFINIASLVWIHTPQGEFHFRTGLNTLKNFASNYVKSDAINSTVRFLTSYRA
ncbi:DUF1294 domain-containing protein [Pseudomaricurvus alcaniphilus]|uniref:DUF1294 domain-containing protein n=1 Tax=Pseudomaricurvus alcaniphilus TaxID=1166482 RepID=UPI00140787D0|nr:DUF1294 domain-containing protein [Pseudomaricurvus alcaniphilus]NHN38638.1 DUF1294 domain-containing protein [Pseudomaricurvus alcaniphilus]